MQKELQINWMNGHYALIEKMGQAEIEQRDARATEFRPGWVGRIGRLSTPIFDVIPADEFSSGYFQRL